MGKPTCGVVDANAMPAAVTALDTLRPRPDVALITGDLTRDGLAEEYAVLREILRRWQKRRSTRPTGWSADR